MLRLLKKFSDQSYQTDWHQRLANEEMVENIDIKEGCRLPVHMHKNEWRNSSGFNLSENEKKILK